MTPAMIKTFFPLVCIFDNDAFLLHVINTKQRFIVYRRLLHSNLYFYSELIRLITNLVFGLSKQ